MQVIGMPFLASLGFISFNAPDMLPLPAFAYMPLPGYMVISFLYLQPIVALFLGLGFMSAVSQSLFNSPLGASRVMLADAVDRLLPEQISRVNKRGAPYVALIVVQVVAILFAVTITLYPGLMGYLTAGAIGSQLVMVFTMLSAMLFPYSAKRIFEVSPSAKYKIAGLPLVSVIGAVGLVYCLVMTSYMIIVPEFGFRGTPVILFIAIYVGLFIYYYGAKWYRSRQGIDVGLAFKEVPPA
jgi:amino acid transporter